jgi:hypothetical protein
MRATDIHGLWLRGLKTWGADMVPCARSRAAKAAADRSLLNIVGGNPGPLAATLYASTGTNLGCAWHNCPQPRFEHGAEIRPWPVVWLSILVRLMFKLDGPCYESPTQLLLTLLPRPRFYMSRTEQGEKSDTNGYTMNADDIHHNS